MVALKCMNVVESFFLDYNQNYRKIGMTHNCVLCELNFFAIH